MKLGVFGFIGKKLNMNYNVIRLFEIMGKSQVFDFRFKALVRVSSFHDSLGKAAGLSIWPKSGSELAKS